MGSLPNPPGAGHGEPIAIVGTGCRFPGSANDSFKMWDLLSKPRDLLSKIPKERFNADAFYHPDGLRHGTSNVTESYFLHEDHRVFDTGFFNIKPVEAHSIDPQQRVLLEAVYESLESAGIPMESLVGSQTAVYVGLMCGDYAEHLQRDIDSMPTYMPTGTARSIISNRISYFFDWHGPSMTIDTACSSSLVAVHQAVQFLRSGESEVAIAAGSNLILEPELYVGESKLKMLSPGSRSRMWDVDADGYARGEGVASIVLKRLSTAIQDGDHIECIIRESSLNQDGRTKGITMPSQTAQADLIARTYAKAGLDPRNKYERCQFFEAHGTGTGAGDGVEAEAISKAFFGPEHKDSDPSTILYCGSIKTVIGHTEGTAGLAGLIKASLAIQHGVVPPNMLFNQLSPQVAPFYHNLRIATKPTPWPHLPAGVPRRASVNSFGFGGSNAHVILETYEPETTLVSSPSTSSSPISFTPFVFSAMSEQALRASLRAYSKYIQEAPDLNLRELSYSLYAKRSTLAVRTAVSAASLESLIAQIGKRLEEIQADPNKSIGVSQKPVSRTLQILGIFTGQGAQWPAMGRQLLLQSPFVRDSIADLDNVLQNLPLSERPNWSLTEQIMVDGALSRVGDAVVAQPICTAIQIVLVDLLRAAGLEFKAVVGHSSGEIAAAYTCGFLNRHEALKIAYYRGLSTKLAGTSTKGAMMAVGTSMEDATELCELPVFEGRIWVAACNSPSSVTLSGDADAIEEAKEVYEEEKKFARILKVEKAYHSHHMLSCSDAYVEALRGSYIEPKEPSTECNWYSSTIPGIRMERCKELGSLYWKDNMVSPVMFSQAISAAVSAESPFDLSIEVGPHPALKGPTLQNQQDLLEKIPPYTGILERGNDDVEAFGRALGLVWSQLGATAVKLDQYYLLVSGNSDRRLIKSLPLYQWDHEKIFWHDSRTSRAYRTRRDQPHPLLGSRVVDGIEDGMRWKNFLKPSELPWVRGHQLQNQTVFPAAGYVSTAIEASRALAYDRPIGLIEICDFIIGKPMTFEDDDSGIEIHFALTEIDRANSGVISANFGYHACTSQTADTLKRLASGRVVITTGQTSPDWLPAINAEAPNMVDVNEDQFYASLDNLGYGYTGDFRTLSSMRRKLNFGAADIAVPQKSQATDPHLLVHPAMLDTAFQSIFLAYWWPNDGSFEQLHVPTSIQNIRVNVGLCEQHLLPGASVPLHSHLTENPLTTSAIMGDVDIFNPGKRSSVIQVEGMRVVAFAERSAQYNQQLFSEHIFDVAFPDGDRAVNGDRATAEDYELAYALERASFYYLKKLDSEIPQERKENPIEWNHEALFDFAKYTLERLRRGTHPFGKKEWYNDTWEDISPLIERHSYSIEMKLTRTVGENLPRAVMGETNILQHLFADNLMTKYYTDAMGLKEFTEFFSKNVSQIVHRYPHMKILEIGAGTGGATKSIMRHIGKKFSSYTYTDISTGFFEEAQNVFAEQAGKMIFKAYDVEKEVEEQGFVEADYDLLLASLVLHATHDLRKTLQSARKLLKPGGYLMMQEITNIDVLRTGFAMSGLPGWWLGRESGRRYSPCITSSEWHKLLLESGFSGIFTVTPETDVLPRPLSIITAQATTDEIGFLRQPLLTPGESFGAQPTDLVIIGGQTLRTLILIDEILRIIRPWDFSIIRVSSIQDIDSSEFSSDSLVLNLAELDKSVWEDFSAETMSGLQQLLDLQRVVLWITQGCRSEQPYQNMSIGLGRSLVLENPDLRLQFIDLDASQKPSPQLIAEDLLRLYLTAHLEDQGSMESMLWSREQELVYEDNRQLIPRLLVSETLNNRYNASKREIIENKDAQDCTFQLRRSKSGYDLIENDFFSGKVMDQTPLESSETYIQVSYSLFQPSAIVDGEDAFLVMGNELKHGETFLGLSQTNGSRLAIPSDKVVHCDVPEGSEPLFLATIETELRVDMIMAYCAPHSTILLHEPEPEVAHRLWARAAEKDLNYAFTSTRGKAIDGPWITIHPRYPSRAIKAVLPIKISTFIDCSIDANSSDSNRLVTKCLPPSCPRINLSDIIVYAGAGSNTNQEPLNSLRTAISRSLSYVQERRQDKNELDSVRIITPEDAATLDLREVYNPVAIKWTMTGKIPLQLCSVESLTHFPPDKTYVFFGLTSDLGTSLCDWFVSRGARNVILTSRNPKIDGAWLEQMKRAGARVEVFSNDITDRTSLEQLVSKIRSNYPPIAGIMHGAMVLEDTSFFEMSFETMNKVLRPKVLGCIHLDELFQDNSLDFFIMYSSLASISGNRGQSNYSAANMYLAATATARRRKGLAGSVLHIGAVMGVGYVTREVHETVFSAIQRAGFKWMSERGFHQCIAESIISGRPTTDANPEIVTGLRVINPDEEEPAPWMAIPRFQHCIVKGASVTEKSNRAKGMVSTKVRLADATSRDQVFEAVKDAFFVKLQAALQIDVDSVTEQERLLNSGPDELGVDSLVAVEIRSWFLKELEVDMPVLKIIGVSTLAELLNFSIDKLSPQLIPNLSDEALPPTISVAIPDPPLTNIAKDRSSSGLDSLDTGLRTQSDEDADNQASSVTSESFDSSSSEKPQMQKVLPMSPGQLRFWFLNHLLDDKSTSNIAFSIKISGPIREDDFRNAVRAMGARHEALRTRFFIDEMQRPMQGILAESVLQLVKKPISHPDEVSREFEAMRRYVFDIGRGEIFRVILLSLSPTQNYLVIGYHHINMDGISLEVFLSDLGKAYNHKKLSQPILQFSDFSLKQRQEIESGKMKQEIQYWKTDLAEHPPPLPLLPFSSTRNRSTLKAYDYNRKDYRIDASLQSRIKKTCQEQKANPFHFYFAVFEVLLFKLLNVDDFCIGMADAGRLNDETSKSMGVYLNLLPLRFRLKSSQTFTDILKETKKKVYSAMVNSSAPFDTILEELKVERSTAYSPLFQAFINYRQGVSEKRSFGSFSGEGGEYAFGRTSYDMTLDIMDNPGSSTLVMFMVQKQFYSHSDAQKLTEIYFNLVKHFIESPKSRLDDVNLFPQEDIESAIELGQGPIHEQGWPETLAHRINEIAREHPNAIAAKDTNGDSVSYQQLTDRSCQIAHALLDAQVGDSSNVVVYQEASIDWVCSLLAVMRVGAVYIPFDVNIPLARLEVMLETCQPSAMLVHPATSADRTRFRARPAMSTIDVSSISSEAIDKDYVKARPKDPVAILYTSGTTGIPKGVILSHSSLCNQVEGVTTMYNFGAETVLQQTALSFDLALDQVMTALCNAGCLIIVPRSVRGDAAAIAGIIAEEKVTYTSGTPSEYLSWLNYGFDDLKRSYSWTSALSVGEQYPWKLVEAVRDLEDSLEHDLRLFNVYGPTEVTVSSNRIELSRETHDNRRIPAGFTLPNCSVYVVDDNLKALPVGMPGEVIIGGAGISIGYLNDGGEKFISDPFATPLARSKGWTRAYRTGDTGILREDGALEIQGRIAGDTQIKLRGIRIEKEDIENAILVASKGVVSNVVVTPRGDPAVLIAHAVLTSDIEEEEEYDFFQRLVSNLDLPQYMRPAAIIPIKSMPLSSHGKVDRRAVAQLSIQKSTNGVSAEDLGSIESQLLEIWESILPEEVMQLHTIKSDSDFFQVGGNSMLLIKLQRAIKESMNLNLPVIRLFESSTLGAMAAVVKDLEDNGPVNIDWEEETTVPSDLSKSDLTTAVTHELPQQVVLTGATGFLGKELLRRLLDSSAVQVIHCIAVRDPDKLSAFDSPKLRIYRGDLRSPICGLSQEDGESISAQADVIIHNGADVSFLKSYQSLRTANVTSTKELFRLAIPHRIPIHYISSVAAGRITGEPTFYEVSLASHPPPVGWKDNYAASKWASEVFLEKAAHQTGMPVWVHRPSSITGEGVPNSDIMHNLMIFSMLTGTVPRSDKWKGVMDFISVEKTAEGILDGLLGEASCKTEGVNFRHHAGEIVVPMEDMKAYLEKESGAEFQVVSLTEWIEKAKEQGLDALVAEYLKEVEKLEEDVVFQKLILGGKPGD